VYGCPEKPLVYRKFVAGNGSYLITQKLQREKFTCYRITNVCVLVHERLSEN